MSWCQISLTRPRAQKSHPCIWCREKIEAGQTYVLDVGNYDGDFQRNKYHPECYAAAQEYFRESGEDTFEPHACARGSQAPPVSFPAARPSSLV